MNDIFALNKEIEDICNNKNMTCIEAIIHLCDIKKLDIEDIAKIVKKNDILCMRIQAEAEDLNYIKKGNRLLI